MVQSIHGSDAFVTSKQKNNKTVSFPAGTDILTNCILTSALVSKYFCVVVHTVCWDTQLRDAEDMYGSFGVRFIMLR